VKGPRQLKQALDLLPLYQNYMIETREETAKLLVEAGIRARSLEVVMDQFGSQMTRRLWPTGELYDIAVDYFIGLNDLPGLIRAVISLAHRRDITPTQVLYDKVGSKISLQSSFFCCTTILSRNHS
jgi:hypothetical protein